MTNNELPITGFLRTSDVLKIFPVSRATLWAKVKTGEFPQPYKLSTSITAWKVEDIKNFIEEITTKSTQETLQSKNVLIKRLKK